MEFGKLSKMTVGDLAKNTATEGGAVVAGLIGSGFLGKMVEKNVGTADSKAAVPSSSTINKTIAWAANNTPKLALYYLLRKEGKQFLDGYEVDIGKGALSSVVLDTLVRAGNSGAPKSLFNLFGYDVLNGTSIKNITPQMQENMQKVLQENSSLRQQLNTAMQRIASASPATPVKIAQTQPIHASPPPDHDRAYGMMQTTPEGENRRKEFGSMTPPIEAERNRKYGSMNKAKLNFAGESESVSAAFGML